MGEIRVSAIGKEDVADVLSLMREFAVYENLLECLEVTEERIEQGLFGDGRTAEGLIARNDGKAVGYAIFFPNFSTFRGQRGFYLEDIYVTEAMRGNGVGEILIRRLARIAAERGYQRIDFLVLDWNISAIGFYKKLGAVMDESERHFKFTDGAFKELAGENSWAGR